MGNYLRAKRHQPKYNRVLSIKDLKHKDTLTHTLFNAKKIENAKSGNMDTFITLHKDQSVPKDLPKECFSVLNPKIVIAIGLKDIDLIDIVHKANKHNIETRFERLVFEMKRASYILKGAVFKENKTHVQLFYQNSLIFQELKKLPIGQNHDHRILEVLNARLRIIKTLNQLQAIDSSINITYSVSKNNTIHFNDGTTRLFSFKFESLFKQSNKLSQHFGLV